MKPSTRSEIKRIIENRHTEAHPFKSNSAGMEWFSRMLPLVGQLTKKELDEFLVPLINDLLGKMDCCSLCTAKLLAFAEIYCSQKSVRKSIRYWIRYQECMADMRGDNKDRDFRAEVYEAIETYLENGERG